MPSETGTFLRVFAYFDTDDTLLTYLTFLYFYNYFHLIMNLEQQSKQKIKNA
jgi:hypothetical protein